jgi:peptidoglycan/xylan/chitin deacetylase (PgdA/CDA1 family)
MSLLQWFFAQSPLLTWQREKTRHFGRVLLFHRVVDDDCHPALLAMRSGEFITRSAFQRQLDYLGKYYQIVSLDEIIRRHDYPGNLVALTFDDGYMDNYRNALPLLKAKGVPATIFVITSMIELSRGFWGNQLARKIVANGPRTLCFDTGNEVKRFEFKGRYQKQLKAARTWLKTLPSEQREALLADQPLHDHDRFLDIDAIKELEQNGITIQAHTVNHHRLSSLDEQAATWEITESKAILEDILGHPVNYFAYPYGGHGDFTKANESATRQAGYRAAFAAYGGYLQPDTDLFTIPRIGSRQDWTRFKTRVTQAY